MNAVMDDTGVVTPGQAVQIKKPDAPRCVLKGNKFKRSAGWSGVYHVRTRPLSIWTKLLRG